MNSRGEDTRPLLVSIIAVNYNCKKWLERFFSSIRAQTIFDKIELILVDNSSTDGSAEICKEQLTSWPNGVFLPTGGNFGFGGGNNRGAAIARGKYLLFVNPDVWFEPNCLEELVQGIEVAGTGAGSPRVVDYENDNIQPASNGFDIFGCAVASREGHAMARPFTVATFFVLRHDLFQKLGGFDEEYFLYAEEMDLSWRVWISGDAIAAVFSAKIHHQGASSGNRAADNRTNESKRFYANRNQLLTLLKNARGLLLVLVLNQIVLIAVEAAVGAILARRLSFMRWSLVKPVADCWRLRGHIAVERRRIRSFRRRGDLWILRRFFTFQFGRWMDVKRLFESGVRIDQAR